MTTIIDGKQLACELKAAIKENLQPYQDYIPPRLEVIMIGEHPASSIYVLNKKRACEEVGIECNIHRLDESITQQEVLQLIDRLNHQETVHGIFVQFPIPPHLNKAEIEEAISPLKDVDGFTSASVSGTVLKGRCTTGEYFNACTPAGIVTLLERLNLPKGSHAVIIGRSDIVGKPLSHLLLQADYTVTVCHSKTKELTSITKTADVLIAAVGIPNFVTKEFVKEGAIVIDVGINRVDGKLCGDVATQEVLPLVQAITPVPGGVGPLTVASLIQNVYYSYQRSLR